EVRAGGVENPATQGAGALVHRTVGEGQDAAVEDAAALGAGVPALHGNARQVDGRRRSDDTTDAQHAAGERTVDDGGRPVRPDDVQVVVDEELAARQDDVGRTGVERDRVAPGQRVRGVDRRAQRAGAGTG